MAKKAAADNGRLRTRRVVRDILIASVGMFMLIHETLDDQPNELLLAAALLVLGIPAGLRLDERLRKNGEG